MHGSKIGHKISIYNGLACVVISIKTSVAQCLKCYFYLALPLIHSETKLMMNSSIDKPKSACKIIRLLIKQSSLYITGKIMISQKLSYTCRNIKWK